MSRSWQRPPSVAMIDAGTDADPAEQVVYLAALPDGPIAVLEGSAAIIFREAVRDEANEDLPARVAAGLGVTLEDVDGESVDAFVKELVERGLLAAW